jgi:osmotically-inducible protein OsmY
MQEKPMRQVRGLMLVISLAACNPIVAATSVVHETYGAATDLRSLSTQETDTQAEVQLKAALLASPVRGTSRIDVYCRQGVMVLGGVVPTGICGRPGGCTARPADRGVKQVETFFVLCRTPAAASPVGTGPPAAGPPGTWRESSEIS